MFNFDKIGDTEIPSWFQFDVEYGKLAVWQQFLIERMEVADEDETTQCQMYLNRIAFTRERIKQLEKEYRS